MEIPKWIHEKIVILEKNPKKMGNQNYKYLTLLTISTSYSETKTVKRILNLVFKTKFAKCGV